MNQENFMGYIVAYAISFLIAVFVTRAIFSIPKFLKLQKAQLQVLTEIAIQQGVKAEVLRTIHVANEVEARGNTNEELRASAENNSNLSALEREALSYQKEQ